MQSPHFPKGHGAFDVWCCDLKNGLQGDYTKTTWLDDVKLKRKLYRIG